ncbi:MAG: AAA family ATPase, partial [Candidatus Rokubacteria bacterium]|nr:AAA family ATPase [Candidatus Rokubacteria bacterium]
LLSKYVGESERAVRETFKKARQAAPCIVFFDEVDALIPVRGAGGSDAHVAERVLAQFLAELDGVEELKGVLVLGATNRPDMLDPAVLRPGRFDTVIDMPPPDRQARSEIFAVHLRNKPLDAGVDIEVLADRSEGMTGADIAGACQRAALAAVRRVITAAGAAAPDEASLRITADDLLAAVEEGPTQGAEFAGSYPGGTAR